MNLMIFSTKGGTGKTRIAVSLAVVVARDTEGKVCLVDFDTSQATAYRILQLRQKDSDARPEQIKSAKSLIQIDPIIYDDTQENLKPFINNIVNTQYEHAIFDTGGYDSELNRAILLYADLVIIPIRPDIGDFWALEDLLDIVCSLKEDGSLNDSIKFCVVLTQCSTNIHHQNDIKMDIDALSQIVVNKGLNDCTFVLKNVTYKRHVYSTSAVQGLSVTESTDKKAAKEFEHIWEEILSIL